MSFDKIIYRLTDKRIPAATGIGLVGDILDRAGFQEQFRNVRSEDKRSRKQIDCGAIMTTFIGLLCMGKPDFDAIAEFQNDAAYYQTALHLRKGFPSAATLRQRMDEIGKTQREYTFVEKQLYRADSIKKWHDTFGYGCYANG